MAFEKEVIQASQSVVDEALAPRKAWETPRFDRQDVRSITEAKAFNPVEATGTIGPMS